MIDNFLKISDGFNRKTRWREETLGNLLKIYVGVNRHTTWREAAMDSF